MRNAYVVVCLGTVCALTGLVACGDNLQGNRPPEASDQNVTTPEDTPVSITVNVNDPDGNGDLTLAFSAPEHGTITEDGATITYRPDDDYNGPDSIFVDISDGMYDTSAEISITVMPVNDAPVAVDDALAASEDTATTVSGAALVANDDDIENDALTVTAVANPSAGTVGLVNDTITYTPANNFTGTATFEYTVSDGAASDVGTVTVTVGGVNDPPVAVNDAVTTSEDMPAVITEAMLVANDTDTEMQTLSVTGVGGAVNGTVARSGGNVTFTPTANYNGAANFTYTVSDGAASATGTVNVTVTAVNDAPVANGQSVTTGEDMPVTITLTGSDVEGSNLTFSIAAQPTAGMLGPITPVNGTSAMVQYTPNTNANGSDSFTFNVDDGTATSATPATVSITVTPANDPPVAMPGATSTMEDDDVVITLVGSDLEGQALTFAIATGSTRGSLSAISQLTPTTAEVTYTPNLNNDQDDSFTFTVNDGGATSAPATITIDVTPVNDGPTANPDTDSTLMNTNLVRNGSAYTGNDTDVDGPPLTVGAVGNPSNGAVSLDVGSQTITFTPTQDYSGPAGFDYTVTDGSLSSTARVSVSVINTNTSPNAVDDADTTPEDVPLVRAASVYTANDTDPQAPPQTLTITAVQNPINGSVSLNADTITFTPSANFFGSGSFDYVVSDGIATDIGTVMIDITTVDDLPLASNDGDSVNEEGSVSTNVLANDVGLGDGGLVVTVTTPAVNGTAVAQGDNTVTYTPSNNFNGTDTYGYTVTDADGDSSSAVVSITVNPVNDAPVAQSQNQTMNENTNLVVTLTATDVDLGAGTLTFAIATGPSNGMLGPIVPTTPTSATVTYTPTPQYTGPDSFTFTASDGTATSAPATVSITVNNVVVCNDGLVEAPETCDDQGNASGDGCSAACRTEQGWNCVGAPSNCDTICNDGLMLGGEACDDGNAVDTDGCTTLCELGPVCSAATFTGGDRFATSPGDGHCYASFDTEQTTWTNARLACVALNGDLVSITSAGEQTIAASVQNTAENPWIGLSDAVVENSFGWSTGEALGFTNWSMNQPDGGASEDCVNFFNTALSSTGVAGTWNDTNCDFIGFTAGRICEIEANPCGDGVLQAAFGEQCDDGNNTSYDGCSLACRVEVGAVCTGATPTTCSKLVINELDYDMIGNDNAEYVELFNAGTAPADLTNVAFVAANGAPASLMQYRRVNLSGVLAPQAYALICPMNSTAGQCGPHTMPIGTTRFLFNVSADAIENGAPDAVGLFVISGMTATPIDLVSYEGTVAMAQITGITGTSPFTEGAGATVANADSNTVNISLQRFPSARDTQSNANDFVVRPPSPGAATPP